MHLISVNASNDHKCRPHHAVRLIATSNTPSVLIEHMNIDVDKWMRIDLEVDLDDPSDEAMQEIQDKSWKEVEKEWNEKYRRWEMSRNAKELRSFCGQDEDDGIWSMSYHILDEETMENITDIPTIAWKNPWV